MLPASGDRGTERASDFPCGEDDAAGLVSARLRRSGYPFLRGVRCEVHEGVTVLSGTVPTFHLKQVAQALASHTPGVRQIDNRLQVPQSGCRTRRPLAG